MVAGCAVESCEFGFCRGEADSEALDFSVPAVGFGLVDPFGQVANDLDEPRPLAGVDAKHGATYAPLVRAGCAVGASAVAEFDLSEMEVLLELRPFGLGRFAIFIAGADGSAPVDEATVGADEVVLIDRYTGRSASWTGARGRGWFARRAA
jgi:hypothetical protein